MARATMAEIITEVRRLANAGTADSTVGTVTYWSDDQLQAVIDAHVRDVKRMPIFSTPAYIDGAYVYTEYHIPLSTSDWRIEREGSGGGFALRDSDGATAPSYTVNFSAHRITFDADTGADTFYLDCRAYDIWLAIAEIYEAKAGMVAGGVDWSSDNHNIKSSQEYQHYMAMADKYRKMSGALVRMSVRRRTDERY